MPLISPSPIRESRNLNPRSPYGTLDPDDADRRRKSSDEFRQAARRGELARGIYSNPWGLILSRSPLPLGIHADWDDLTSQEYHDVVEVLS